MLTALQKELIVEHMVPAACCLKFWTRLTSICIDCISSFPFTFDRLKTNFYFKIKVNGTDHTSPSQDPVSGCPQFKSDIAHLVLVKLFSVCKGPPGFLNTENSQEQDDKCIIGAWSTNHKEIATRHLVSLIYSGQQTLMKFTFERLKGTCLDKQCNC